MFLILSLLLAELTMLLLFFQSQSSSMDSSRFHNNQRINASYFYRYPNQIYVSVPTDGSRFYYRGEPIAAAQQTPFPIIDSRHEPRAYEAQTPAASCEALQRDSRASPYLADGSRVFYQTRLLDVPDDEALRTLHYAARGGFDLLYHTRGGALLAGGEALNPDRPPTACFPTATATPSICFSVMPRGCISTTTKAAAPAKRPATACLGTALKKSTTAI